VTVGCAARLRGARSAGLLARGAAWRRRALPRGSQGLDLDSRHQADADSFEHLAGAVDGDAGVLVALVAEDCGLVDLQPARKLALGHAAGDAEADQGLPEAEQILELRELAAREVPSDASLSEFR